VRLDFVERSRPYPGEVENGDAIVVRREANRSLLAVIDGLGHGPKASSAAAVAAQCLQTVDLETPMNSLMQGVHQALSGTRGVAATVIVLLDARLRACAVGNVELRVSGAKFPFRLTAGILGRNLKRLYVADVPLVPARLALYSDGVAPSFYLDDYAGRPLGWSCNDIFARFARSTDDASLLLADILP